jgi:hypothetical protein
LINCNKYIAGVSQLFDDWRPTFETYLNERLGPLDMHFTIVPLDFDSTYTAAANKGVREFAHQTLWRIERGRGEGS